MTAGDTGRGSARRSAEVWAQPGRLQQAAAALQQLGFRVLHLGSTISVDAPGEVWVRVFGDSFRTGQLSIPPSLRDLLLDVALVEPPDLHR